MSKAIVFFADGFEECEGLLVVDLLRRAGVDVKTASINGSTKILSSHGITLFADLCAEDADYAAADIVILPGGLKGTENLAASSFCVSFLSLRAFLMAGPATFMIVSPSPILHTPYSCLLPVKHPSPAIYSTSADSNEALRLRRAKFLRCSSQKPITLCF